MDKNNIKVSKDGNQWCVLIGKNLQEGIAGFGKTENEAFNDLIKKNKINKCEHCVDVEAMDQECPTEPYEGLEMVCDECGATYHEEHGGYIYASNYQAKINHPELKLL